MTIRPCRHKSGACHRISILQDPGLEYGAAAQGSMEGVGGEAEQQDDSGKPDSRVPGRKLWSYREEPQQKIGCVVCRVRQQTEAHQEEADNSVLQRIKNPCDGRIAAQSHQRRQHQDKHRCRNSLERKQNPKQEEQK